MLNPLPTTPDQETISVATQVSRDLAKALASGRMLKCGKNGTRFTVQLSEVLPPETRLPFEAVRLLQALLQEMAKGNAVTILPANAELTTQEAADLLGVSRPFLIGLLEEGKIPHRKVGTHRRVLTADVVTYKQQIDEARRKTLDDLVAEAQNLEMGY